MVSSKGIKLIQPSWPEPLLASSVAALRSDLTGKLAPFDFSDPKSLSRACWFAHKLVQKLSGNLAGKFVSVWNTQHQEISIGLAKV